MQAVTAFQDVYTDLNRLGEVKRQSRHDAEGALRTVARQFEGMFVKMMIKSMRDASFGDPLFDNQTSELYRDMYDQQLSLELTRDHGIGLADTLVAQMKRFLPANGAVAIPGTGELETQPLRAAPVSVPAPAATMETASKQAQFDSPRDFIQTLMPAARDAADTLGVDPGLLLAQAALETGWGKYVMHGEQGSAFNLFGIKADQRWAGRQVTAETMEVLGGTPVKRVEAFRAYDSFQQSFSDYASFIRSSDRYAGALQHAEDPRAYVDALQQAGYATDPRYAEKIMRIWQEHLQPETRVTAL